MKWYKYSWDPIMTSWAITDTHILNMHWKSGVVVMPTLLPLAAPVIVIKLASWQLSVYRLANDTWSLMQKRSTRYTEQLLCLIPITINGWLTDWLTDWLADWLTDWLVKWLITLAPQTSVSGIMWDANTNPYPWYLLWAPKSSTDTQQCSN